MAPPRGKKRKTESSDSPDSQAKGANEIEVEHGDLWFPDGSVVLIAENKGFKVRHTLLLRSSNCSRTLLGISRDTVSTFGVFPGHVCSSSAGGRGDL